MSKIISKIEDQNG